MQLYLASIGLGQNHSGFCKPEIQNKRVAIIPNALDYWSDLEWRKCVLQKMTQDLSQMGLKPEVLNLRDFFDQTNELRNQIENFSYLWVTGGNTFVLRRAFAQSGFDAILKAKRKEKDFVYGGYSAGACVLAPTLKGIHLADDPQEIPDRYTNEIIWEGLNFIPYSILPHFKSHNPESLKIDQAFDYMINHKIPFIALKDGESLQLHTH